LQKSQQPKIVSPLLIPVTGRAIRKLQPEKEAPPKETTSRYFVFPPILKIISCLSKRREKTRHNYS